MTSLTVEYKARELRRKNLVHVTYSSGRYYEIIITINSLTPEVVDFINMLNNNYTTIYMATPIDNTTIYEFEDDDYDFSVVIKY